MAGGGLGGLFSSAGSSAEQLFIWQVLGSIISSLLAPVVQELQQDAFKALPNTPLDPTVAASLVAQAILNKSDGAGEAELSGVDSSRFDHLITSAGNSLDIGSVVAAFQRGLVGEGNYDPTDISLSGAMASGAIREDWLPILKQLTISIPSIAEVMNAWLEGQIEEGEAHTRYLAAGGDPTWFQTSYNANGQAPTPVELLELVNRGIIPKGGTGPTAVSYEQGFLEGPWRNKWSTALFGLAAYLPPPRTITAMFHDGQLSQSQAAALLAKQGLTTELIAAYLSPSKTATATTEKALAKSDILSLYSDQLITDAKAESLLVALHYPADEAKLLIELQDFKVQKAALTNGVAHVRTLYQGGKLTKSDATSELEALDIPGPAAKDLINVWDVTTVQTVKLLTPAQIIDAWYYALQTTDETLGMLEALGYDAIDAWLLLAIKNKGPLKDVPAPAGAGVPKPAPVPAPAT